MNHYDLLHAEGNQIKERKKLIILVEMYVIMRVETCPNMGKVPRNVLSLPDEYSSDGNSSE